MANPHYEFEYRISESTVADLVGRYFYDTGEVVNGSPVLYDTAGQYAHWKMSADDFAVTTVADVDTVTADLFQEDDSGFLVYTGEGLFSGETLTLSSVNLSDAWYRAEQEAFESLRAFVGATEGVDCFRGFMPVQGDSDDFKLVNVWQMTSGGSGEFDITRLSADGALWCSLRADVRIESLWEDRVDAMKFAGAVQAWLQYTNNLAQTGNVTWCSLADIPAEPVIYRTSGVNRKRYWQQDIELDLVYKTGDEY